MSSNNETPTISVISDALNYHDINKEKYSDLINSISYYRRVESDSLVQNVTYRFFDDKDNELFTSRVELIGQYHINKANENENNVKSWTWGWAIPITNKYFTNVIKKVLLYGTDINVRIDGKMNDDNLLLKSELITSRFFVSDNTQVDIHCALASYLSKIPLIMSFANIGNFDEKDETKIIYTKYEKNSNYNGVVFYMYILDEPEV